MLNQVGKSRFDGVKCGAIFRHATPNGQGLQRLIVEGFKPGRRDRWQPETGDFAECYSAKANGLAICRDLANGQTLFLALEVVNINLRLDQGKSITCQLDH
jgi:hypothetical protein